MQQADCSEFPLEVSHAIGYNATALSHNILLCDYVLMDPMIYL